jgi:hypothetical protein
MDQGYRNKYIKRVGVWNVQKYFINATLITRADIIKMNDEETVH